MWYNEDINKLNNMLDYNTIKSQLLGRRFDFSDCNITILRIRKTKKGDGFWWVYLKDYSDGSSGMFRQFQNISDYNFEEFCKNIINC